MSTLISLALFLVMMALGLHPPTVKVGLLIRRPVWLLRVLVTTCIGIPIAALLLLRTPLGQGLSPSMATALMLMAICPSAPLISLKSRLVAGNAGLAARLQLWSACAAILSVPIWVNQLPIDVGETLWSISGRDVAAQVLCVQVFPLLAGMSLRRWCSTWAERWNQVVQKTASILLLMLLAVVLVTALPKVSLTLIADLRGAFLMLLLTLIALLLGYGIASDDQAEKSTIPMVMAMRNPGLALLLVQQMAPEASELKAAIVGYVMMTVFGMTPFLRWRQRLADPTHDVTK